MASVLVNDASAQRLLDEIALLTLQVTDIAFEKAIKEQTLSLQAITEAMRLVLSPYNNQQIGEK